MTTPSFTSKAVRGFVAAFALAASASAFAAATIVIQNLNAAGVGFNDPTPVAPVGGNAGTTLGQQRLNAFTYAASIWGATITSAPFITIASTFEPLACNATGAVLGSAGATTVHGNFTGAPLPNTWYSGALANKLFGSDLDTSNAEIRARFNVNLGAVGCLTGIPFYLGLDNNHGTAVDLVAVLLHEFGHGLGFQNFTSGTTGQFLGPPSLPSVWDYYLFDETQNLSWVNMTPAQRVASAINVGKVVWTGVAATSAAASVLSYPPQVAVAGPAAGAAAGAYPAGNAAYGPVPSYPGVMADIMPIANGGCNAYTAAEMLAAKNNLVLVDRGVCTFAVKTQNAQNALAKGVIIANNVDAALSPGGSASGITIPTVGISLSQGSTIKASLATRSRSKSGVIGTIGVNTSAPLAGTSASGRVQMYTPNPFESGSSVSHWNTTAFRNLLMEPAINGDLTHSVVPPEDLTYRLLQDVGW